ncbi:NAD-dependent epimerase/dehydratase family protein [Mycobacterium sp. 236(2023)]|uniref:NAD-dependent epimerase/dehydratase family protein n=1 Tax=Mycobacterium sp. 236(2023) TaxID=3038163 RepID=UPI002414DAFA|nr:NAD-dependent epimerase/dehydratase family protein [Mycobacterium sp. 236(2023)]MDG4664602.1 NAD-dependent epimerase/dehydratase family protein [Mycobacterium sp. 236(2023)]
MHSDTTVLVTGAAGYVGSHVVNQLLRRGYRVRAAVRSDRRADEVRRNVAAEALDTGRLEFALTDLGADEGWREAATGTTFVMHVASPFPSHTPRTDDEIIAPARDGTLRVLAAARDAGCSRVVLTSSFAAVGYSPSSTDNWSEADWTDPSDTNTAYIRSKAIAERAAWDFVASEGESLELTTIVPVGIFGPTIGEHLSTSVRFIQAMLTGEMERVLPQYFGVVDVRDVADAHLRAMTTDAAAGERILVVADGPAQSFLGPATILRKGLGESASRVPTAEFSDEEVRELAQSDPVFREALSQLGKRPRISNAKAKELLGWMPRPVHDTILDTARSLLDTG